MLDILIYGTIAGVAMALQAAGFSLCYSVSRLPNFAHGALYILAGLSAWTALRQFGLPYPIAVALGVAATSLLGFAIYRLLVIRVRGIEASEIILTFALSIVVLEGLREYGFKGGASYVLPALARGSIGIFGVPVDLHSLLMLPIAAAVAAGLWIFVHRTRSGLALRAIAQDEQAAQMLGIDADRAAAMSLSVGSALAALAAVIVLPRGTITVEAAYSVLVVALAVSILGGLGSVWGTMIAALILGLTQRAVVTYVGNQFENVVAFAFIVVVLVARPSGLFGRQKELEERV
jgi:branched-chain amino acid transport system permease protein